MDSRSDSSGSLSGRRVIITRPRRQAERLAAELQRFGAQTILIPTIEILPPTDWAFVDSRLHELETYDWLIFTSVNGIEHFLRRLDEVRRGRAALHGLRVAAVGPGTRKRLDDERIVVDLQPRVATAADLATELIDHYASLAELNGLRVLVPTSNLAQPVIQRTLTEFGVTVDVVEVYRTGQAAMTTTAFKSQFSPENADDIIFASPSAITSLASIFAVADLSTSLAGLRVLCIGKVTAETAERLGLTVHLQADEPTVDSIVNALRMS